MDQCITKEGNPESEDYKVGFYFQAQKSSLREVFYCHIPHHCLRPQNRYLGDFIVIVIISDHHPNTGMKTVLVGSCLCSKRFSPGSVVFISPRKLIFPNSNLTKKQWIMSHSVETPL